MPDALITSLGTVPYEPTAELQRRLHEARVDGRIPDTLLVLEHHSVVTCGSRTEPHEVASAQAHGVPVVATERGGKATWHGPGQIVIYPIADLTQHGSDIKRFVCDLEAAIIRTLAACSIEGARRPGFPGVWIADSLEAVRPRKIASLGLRVREWTSLHGLALNIDCDLTPFSWFTPCGIPDADMTSVRRQALEAGRPAPDAADVKAELIANVLAQFAFTPLGSGGQVTLTELCARAEVDIPAGLGAASSGVVPA